MDYKKITEALNIIQDTKYFHNFIYQRSELRFVKGRLKFGDGTGSAPFPSMIVIFRGAYV